MSIKTQRTLFISALAVIALTVVELIGLNYIVEKISRLNPPSVAMAEPPKSSDDMVVSDQAANPFNKPGLGMPLHEPNHGPNNQPHPSGVRPDKKPFPTVQDGTNGLRHGKDAAGFRRNGTPAKPSRDDAGNNDKRPSANAPAMKDRPMMPPPMPDGRQLDPAEREQFEQEMERRREMFYGSDPRNGPPPGFFPPGPPPGFSPDDYYNGPDDGYDPNDYDYDYDLEGSNKDKKSENHRIAKTHPDPEPSSEDAEDPDIGLEDEYINDHEE